MSVIQSLGTICKVFRFAPDEWIKGRIRKSTSFQQFEIRASIQRLTPRELEILPEGRRTKESIKIYTEFYMHEPCEEKNRRGDVIRWQGRDYEVHKVERWNDQPLFNLRHYKAIAQRIEEDSE